MPTEFDKNVISEKHLRQFQSYLKEHNLIPIEIEKCVFNRENLLAGTIDAIFKIEGIDELVLVDFKRKKSIKHDNYFDKHSSIIPDTEYSRILLQLNLYRHLLNDERVSQIYCVAIHPEIENIIIEEFPVITDR